MSININFEINIVQWNCQSLVPKFSELDLYLHREKVHICILSETWLSYEQQLNISDFSIFRKDRADGYGGLAILVHHSIGCVLKNLQFTYNNIDTICIELLNCSKLKYVIGVYSPPNVPVNNRDYEELFSHFSEKTLIAGDFNAHHAAWSYTTDARGRLLSDTSLDHNFIFLNNGDFTRCAKHHDNIICTSPDLTFCSSDMALEFDWHVTNETFGSDHLLISIKTLDSTFINTEQKRNFKKADWVLYTQEIQSACEDLSISNNLQDSYNTLVEIIEESANKYIPLIKYSPHPKKFRPKPWWSPLLSKVVAERRLALKQFRKSRTFENYTKYRERVVEARKLIKQAKRNSWQQFCNSIDSNMSTREVWRKMRWLKGYRSPKDYLQEDAAVSFLSDLSPDSVSFQPYQFDISASGPHNLLTLSDLDLIFRRKDTSAGLDNITYSMINNLPIKAKEILIYIYNIIYKTGQIPEQWRGVKLIAIPKRNTDALKHRPISLMNCLCKTFNLIVSRRLEYHFENKKLFNNCTMGFRRGFSCQDNISRFIIDTETAFVDKEYVLCAYGDISNAYNNVAVDSLISALVKFDVDPFLCRYVRELLKERTLIYRLCDGREVTRICRQGIAQGDPMSPILFNIVTINLCNSLINTVHLSQYADDFALYYIHKDIEVCIEVMQTSLNIFTTILESIGLDISLSKTKLCIMTRKYKVPCIKITINNIDIEVLNCVKFLGVWVDSRLNWTRHVKETAQKCAAYVNILSSVSGSTWGIHPTQLRRLYISLIRSRLDYGSISYGNASPNLLKKLDVVQNQCLRICGSFIRDTPIFAMESELCIPPLGLRRSYLSNKYFLKLSARTSDYSINQLHALDDKFKSGLNYWRKNQIPLLVDSFRRYSNLHISKFEIFPRYQLPLHITTLPWDKIITTNVSSINDPKAQMSRKDLKQCSEDMIRQQYAEFYQIYTDGSKTIKGSGCAFYDEGADFGAKFLIDNQCIPIMGIELVAINEAVHYIESTTYRKIVVLTDSKSSLLHLLGCAKGRNVKVRKEALLAIKCIYKLIRSGVEVILQWIPSHVGITGNEKADSLTTLALQDGVTLDVEPHYTDYFPQVKRDIHSMFKTYFNECSQTKGHWYKSIVNEPPRIPWFSTSRLNRRELVICFRTRTNHIPLNRFNFIMRKRDDPNCTRCGREEDLLHIVLECKINEQLRLEFLKDTRCSLGELLFFFHQILSSNFSIEHSDRLLSFLIHSLNLRIEYIKSIPIVPSSTPIV